MNKVHSVERRIVTPPHPSPSFGPELAVEAAEGVGSESLLWGPPPKALQYREDRVARSALDSSFSEHDEFIAGSQHPARPDITGGGGFRAGGGRAGWSVR